MDRDVTQPRKRLWRHTLLLAAALIALDVADAVLTFWAANKGLIYEGNPLMASIADTWAIIALKAIMAVVIAFGLCFLAVRRPHKIHIIRNGFVCMCMIETVIMIQWCSALMMIL
ncbi:MAG TPA: hypothetical protein G4O10_09355 [Dehalococcoidia bacterium]|nr:hypothetical protein [Dehalococcoidia bacterium]